jgi:hypothetical protein
MKSMLYSNRNGSVFITAAVTAAILSILVAGIVSFLTNEYRLNFRSHSWNQALHLAEAGLEYGFGQFTYQGNLFQSAPSGWDNQGGTYSKSVIVTNAANQVVGRAVVSVTGVGSLTPQLQSIGTTYEFISPTNSSRAVKVTLGQSWRFPVGLMSKNTIDMNGNNIYSDSYDSSDASKSSSNKYDPNKKQPNGNVASNATITNTVSVGNADIYGTVSTGPGGTVSMGPNGSVGNTFVSGDRATTISAAIASGYVQNNFNTDIPSVTLPSGLSSAPVRTINGSTTIGSSGGAFTYQTGSINLTGNGNNNTVIIEGNVTLYVAGNVDISGTGGIQLAQDASLTVYVGGNVTIAGNGVLNQYGTDLNNQWYGLPSSTSWTVNGNGSWSGTMYAPEAAMTLNGGGNSNNDDMSGSVVANSITLGGHTSFHYDERLKSGGPVSGFVVSSWQELQWNGSAWVP